MKIKFLKDCSMEVVEHFDDVRDVILDKSDVTFHEGEVVEGDIFNDEGSYVNFQFGDGSCVFGLHKENFTVEVEA